VTVLGIVLAAGVGSRFARSGGAEPKARTPLAGLPLLVHAVRAAAEAGLDEVVVVQGSVELGDLVPPDVSVLGNPRWSEGIATSLQVGLAHATERGHDTVVVGLADQPGVTSSAWRALAAAALDPPIAVATYDGRRGNPVRLAEAVWPLLPRAGDEGARAVMRERPELVAEVPCTGDPWDVDTVEDLERWS
jgi:CTP:molybdopterin cytidylyltransferase MocA